MTLFSKKGRRCGPKGLSLPLILTFISLGLSGYSAMAAQDIFSVTDAGRITAHMTNLPLPQALAALSRSMPLEIRGSVAGDEKLTLHFSGLTLGEALREMMAGYNYVLITPKGQGKPVLVVLGKAEKGRGTTPPSEERTAPVPPPAAPAPTSASAPPPPMTPPESAGKASGRQAAATEEHVQPDSNQGGAGQNPDSEPPFNPAAWGGRGFRGSAPSGRK